MPTATLKAACRAKRAKPAHRLVLVRKPPTDPIWSMPRAKATEEIVRRNQGLVHALAMKISKRYGRPQSDLEDLVADGNVGLLSAIKHFDVNFGYAFCTYAYPAIWNAIKQGIEDRDFVGGKARKKGNQQQMINMTSLRVDSAATDIVRRKCDIRPTNAFIAVDQKIDLGRLLNHLPTRDRQMVRLRVIRKEELHEIGEKHGVTKERVRQIVDRSLAKLRKYIERNKPEYVPIHRAA